VESIHQWSFNSRFGLGWASSAKDVFPWIQMRYPSGIVITSFHIFVRTVPGKNITSWNVQCGNDPGGSEFNTLLASNSQLIANNYYSFNIYNSTAYKVYRFHMLTRSGTSGSAFVNSPAQPSDIGISLLQFNTPNITSNGYTPTAANLIMNRNKIINVLDPVSGSDVATRGFVEQLLNSLSNLPVAELTSAILSKTWDNFLDTKGQKIRNLDSPTAISDGATKGYVDAAIAAVKAGIAPVTSAESAEDVLTRSIGDNLYVKPDGTSVMDEGLDMGRFGNRNVRDPSLSSDVPTKGYTDRAIAPITSKVDEITNKVTEITNSVVKLDGSSIMTGTLDMGRNSIKNLRDPIVGNEVATKGYVDRNNTLNVRYDGVTAHINMQQHKLTNLLDPIDNQDCATKKYVDDSMFADRLIGVMNNL
jgi:hypothetical protein